MHSKVNSLDKNKAEANPFNVSNPTVWAEPWWNTMGYTSISPATVRGSVSDSSSLEQSMDGQS
jgi:hypothetical protein